NDGPPANAPLDADTGPNDVQNFPVLTSAVTNAAGTTVQGTLASKPNTVFCIELFASDAADPSGFGEAQTFLGFTSVATDAQGIASFTFHSASPTPVGKPLTATATEFLLTNTSEVSAAVAVALLLPGVVVTPVSGLTTSEAGGSAVFTVVLTTVPAADVTVTLDSSDPGEGSVLPTTLTFTPANALTPQTVTVTGVDDGLVDGDIGYTLVTGAATSADPNYNGLDAADVPLVNVDDDAPGAPAPGNGGPPAP